MTDLYLVRHAQPRSTTKHTLRRIFTFFNPDASALSDLGRTQALLTGQSLRRFSASIIYTSPVPRALETAKVISKCLELDIYVRNDLQEQSLGSLLKKVHPNDIQKKFPEDWHHLQSGEPSYAPLGGESTGVFLSRVDRFLIDMENIPGSVIAITHFGFIQGVVSIILGLSFRYSMPLDFGEASITHVRIQEGERVLVSLNETNHWETALGLKSPSFRVQ
jgi:broad specificity phosphatase PhoE